MTMKKNQYALVAASLLAGAVSASGAVTMSLDGGYGSDPGLITVDPSTVTNASFTLKTEGNSLAQSIVLAQAIDDITQLTMSIQLLNVNESYDIDFNVYSVTDTGAAWGSNGAALLHTFTATVGANTTNSGHQLSMNLSGGDIISLAAGSYALEIVGHYSGPTQGTTPFLGGRFSNNGTDNYADGRYYANGSIQSSTRDLGVGIVGTVVPEPSSALLGGIGLLGLLRRRRSGPCG